VFGPTAGFVLWEAHREQPAEINEEILAGMALRTSTISRVEVPERRGDYRSTARTPSCERPDFDDPDDR
jgi:hypothetical protein